MIYPVQSKVRYGLGATIIRGAALGAVDSVKGK